MGWPIFKAETNIDKMFRDAWWGGFFIGASAMLFALIVIAHVLTKA